MLIFSLVALLHNPISLSAIQGGGCFVFKQSGLSGEIAQWVGHIQALDVAKLGSIHGTKYGPSEHCSGVISKQKARSRL